MSDWWTKKLAGEKPTPQPRIPGIPYTPTQQPQAQPQPRQVTPQDLPKDEHIPMGAAIRMWKGGEAHRKEGDMSCPDCGSKNVFTRSKNNIINGKAPAPRCFECGWNGLYEQATQISWTN